MIGSLVAILAGGGAAALGSPATAKLAVKRDAPCAKGPKSNTKRAKRHARCKKPKLSQAKLLDSAAEADARALLAELPLPEGAVEVVSEPGFNGPAERIGCRTVMDVDRYWHVPGEPKTVIAWIVSDRPPAADGWGQGEGGTAHTGFTKWFGSFEFTANEPDVKPDENLVFEAVTAEGGGTALRADAQVVPADATCIKHVPSRHARG